MLVLAVAPTDSGRTVSRDGAVGKRCQAEPPAEVQSCFNHCPTRLLDLCHWAVSLIARTASIHRRLYRSSSALVMHCRGRSRPQLSSVQDCATLCVSASFHGPNHIMYCTGDTSPAAAPCHSLAALGRCDSFPTILTCIPGGSVQPAYSPGTSTTGKRAFRSV